MLVAELNHTRPLGAEFEAVAPIVGAGGNHDVQQTFANVFSSNGLRSTARAYSHQPIPQGYDLAVESDSSLRPESQFQGVSWSNIEIKTRPLQGIADWQAVVPKTLQIAKYLGARVNRSCGHHLHVAFPEAREAPAKIRSIFNLLYASEPLLYSFLPPSRTSNGYAVPMQPEHFRLLHGCRSFRSFRDALAGWQRNSGLNLTPLFGDSPRIEFRYHSATLDHRKAEHWMRLVNRLVEHAVTRNCQAQQRRPKPTLAAIDNWLMTIGMRSNSGIYTKVAPELRETAKFLRRRFKHLNQMHATGDNEHAHASVEEEEA